MAKALTTDSRGVIVSCAACGTANRIGFKKLDQQGRCGTCQAALPKVDQPVEIGSLEAFQSLITDSPLPVVVDFWAAWCGPCQMMTPEFAKAASLAAGEAVMAKVNTDEQPEIAGQFRIQGIPAFVVIRGGRLAAQTAGFQPAAKLVQWVRGAG